MQTDVEDGAAALIKAGIVDGKRVCMMRFVRRLRGASWRHADADRHARDQRRWRKRSRGDDEDADRGGREAPFGMGGASPWAATRIIRRDSRRSSAPEQVKIPILLTHGAEDTVLKSNSSETCTRS